MRAHRLLFPLFALILTAACGTNDNAKNSDAGGAGGGAGADGSELPGVHPVQYVFVIAMENHDQAQIIGNTADAPYINNTLAAGYASTSKFTDLLPLVIPSEPHYVWMEAGTNAFGDHTFTSDDAPSASNSTASTDHLSTELDAKGGGLTWRSYQEGIGDMTGACPIKANGYYLPKHDPFIFFQDVSGNPPAADNAYCVSHHKEIGALGADLSNASVARYNFITPNQCHDMHGQSGCPNSNTIEAGDQWLAANMPSLIDFANAHDGVIFVVWDEGSITLTIPFLAVGPGVKKGYVSDVEVSQSSLLKTVERIFALPGLSTVAQSQDLGDLFLPGALP